MKIIFYPGLQIQANPNRVDTAEGRIGQAVPVIQGELGGCAHGRFERKAHRRAGQRFRCQSIQSVVEESITATNKKLKEELDFLKTIERPRVSAQIAEARDKGDLSENAEYDAAKEAQGLLEMKISKMEDLMANARIMDASQMDTSKVFVLSTVRIRNQKNGQELKYTLVAEQEADLKLGKISVSSPIGKGLLGKTVGEVAEITIPNGTLALEVLEITR